MNIYSLAEDSVALSEVGYCIDTSQRIKLQMGLLRLSETANADQLLFWGKIQTTSKPYYIAVGIDFKGHFSFVSKKFYYSTDDFNFKPLPELDKFNQGKVDNLNSQPFTGNPSHVLINVEGAAEGEDKKQPEGKEVQEDDSEEEVQKIVPKSLTEEDRLSYVVKGIEIQCQLAPRGAFKMISEHEIRYNNTFQPKQQMQLTDFQHFRYPQSEAAKSELQSSKAIFSEKIFDEIENQLFWSIQPNLRGDLYTVRSLAWPGYLSYVFTNRNVFGGVYFGNGLKNTEIAFFL